MMGCGFPKTGCAPPCLAPARPPRDEESHRAGKAPMPTRLAKATLLLPKIRPAPQSQINCQAPSGFPFPMGPGVPIPPQGTGPRMGTVLGFAVPDPGP